MNELIVMLTEIITDRNLVWDRQIEKNPNLFISYLSEKTINQLFKNRTQLLELPNPTYTLLLNEIQKLKKTLLNDGFGFFVIDGNSFKKFSKEEIRQIYTLISMMLGSLYFQNISNEKFVEIKNEGKSMKSGGRYHQTNEGGSYHTDSPQVKNVPDFIGLLCINPAKSGGSSKFVSVYTLHNILLKKHFDNLKILYSKFYFDKRGEFYENESPVIFEPILKYENDFLSMRYLRDYIDGGYKIMNKHLTPEQIESLNLLDKIIENNEIIVSYNLKSNDMVFFNNHRVIHGRTSFDDYEDKSLQRLLIRTWIKDNS